MNDSQISVRYAKALFQLANEKNLLNAIKEDIVSLNSVYKESAEFVSFFESPRIRTSEKKAALKILFPDKLNKLTFSFLELLVTNSRELHLNGIIRQFLSLYYKKINKKESVLTTAVPLSEESKAKFISFTSNLFKSEIELVSQVDEQLIGGFVLRVDDKQIDASVSTKLRKIRQELLA